MGAPYPPNSPPEAVKTPGLLLAHRIIGLDSTSTGGPVFVLTERTVSPPTFRWNRPLHLINT
jgi:hypothetical protein